MPINHCLYADGVNGAEAFRTEVKQECTAAAAEEQVSVMVAANGMDIVARNRQPRSVIGAENTAVVARYAVESVACGYPYTPVLVLVESINAIMGQTVRYAKVFHHNGSGKYKERQARQ